MADPVLLPATFVGLRTERFLFSVTDRLDAVSADASLDQRVLHRIRPVGTQRQVVLGRSALVAMALNRDADIRVLLQELRVGLQRTLLVPPDIVLVVLEEDVLHVFRE